MLHDHSLFRMCLERWVFNWSISSPNKNWNFVEKKNREQIFHRQLARSSIYMLLIFFLFIWLSLSWPIAEMFKLLEGLFSLCSVACLPLCIQWPVLSWFAPRSLISSLDLYSSICKASSSDVHNETYLLFHACLSSIISYQGKWYQHPSSPVHQKSEIDTLLLSFHLFTSVGHQVLLMFFPE